MLKRAKSLDKNKLRDTIAGQISFNYQNDCALPPSAILKVDESDETTKARARLNCSTLHNHAEKRETSLVMKRFPGLLKKRDEIKNLKPVTPTIEVFFEAELRGKWKELSPLG